MNRSKNPLSLAIFFLILDLFLDLFFSLTDLKNCYIAMKITVYLCSRIRNADNRLFYLLLIEIEIRNLERTVRSNGWSWLQRESFSWDNDNFIGGDPWRRGGEGAGAKVTKRDSCRQRGTLMSQTTVELNSTPRKAHKRTFLPRQIVVESYRSNESYSPLAPRTRSRIWDCEEKMWKKNFERKQSKRNRKKREKKEKWKASTVKLGENKPTDRQVNA